MYYCKNFYVDRHKNSFFFDTKHLQMNADCSSFYYSMPLFMKSFNILRPKLSMYALNSDLLYVSASRKVSYKVSTFVGIIILGLNRLS